MRGFLIRLVAYALPLYLAFHFANGWWSSDGLDAIDALRVPHDVGNAVLTVAPFVLALAGFGRLRGLAVFLACFLTAAALTAPFAYARIAGI